MAEKAVIWGAGGHAKVVADILRLSGLEVVGFLDEVNSGRRGQPFFGSVVLGGVEQLDSLLHGGVRRAFVGFGNNRRRLEAGNLLESRGFELVKAIHPAAVVAADVKLGVGTMVAAGAVVNPGSGIGKNVIVNTCASIDHDCVVDDGAHVGPGASVAGSVTIGRCAWLGIGSTIIDKKHVGADSIVGAGAVVIHDVPDGATVAGVPAQMLRRAKRGDSLL
ncbi:MAG TPA: acetyltransferase [Candidatus Paceibacterota bacterium]|nr:acetyltransferase [Candidatus Paceibacterota bacterium]